MLLPDADLYYLGGGQDRDQLLIADDIARHAEPLRAAVDDGAGVLAVCGGYQLLGHYYRGHQGDEMRGIGLVDLVTEAGDRRMIGNIMLDCRLRGGGPAAAGRIREPRRPHSPGRGRTSARARSCTGTATTARTAERAFSRAR